MCGQLPLFVLPLVSCIVPAWGFFSQIEPFSTVTIVHAHVSVSLITVFFLLNTSTGLGLLTGLSSVTVRRKLEEHSKQKRRLHHTCPSFSLHLLVLTIFFSLLFLFFAVEIGRTDLTGGVIHPWINVRRWIGVMESWMRS